MAPSSYVVSLGDMNLIEVHERVEKMEVFPTKFIDEAVGHKILSYPDICHFAVGSDWFRLLRIGRPTYPQLCREFLRSMRLHFAEEQSLDYFAVEAVLGGIEVKLGLKELNIIYGIKNTQQRTSFSEFDCHAFWKTITVGRDYMLATSRASEIRNPTLRYFYYVIASTIMGRSKWVDKVCPWDLFALWGLTIGNHINMTYFMFKHIQDVVLPYDAAFVMGGLLTPIAEYCGVDLSKYEQYGQRTLDFGCLFELRMLSPLSDGAYLLHFADRKPMRLPDFDRIRLNKSENWQLNN